MTERTGFPAQYLFRSTWFWVAHACAELVSNDCHWLANAEHAAVLLLHSDEPVTSIGRAVGWPDQSGFARRFKAHYGLSATAYRKRFATRAAQLHHPTAAAS
jgi:methylphosphotriester-DNA--protein-cysteine methyltransferase